MRTPSWAKERRSEAPDRSADKAIMGACGPGLMGLHALVSPGPAVQAAMAATSTGSLRARRKFPRESPREDTLRAFPRLELSLPL